MLLRPRHRVDALAAEANFEDIFLGDQLRIQREAGEVLAGFAEATPEYAPMTDGLGALWASRVLWAAQPGLGRTHLPPAF